MMEVGKMMIAGEKYEWERVSLWSSRQSITDFKSARGKVVCDQVVKQWSSLEQAASEGSRIEGLRRFWKINGFI